MKRLLALLCGAAVSVPAMAADWQPYAQTDDFVYFYDRSSVRKSGKRVRVWVLYDYTETQGAGDFRYRSMKALNEYDCVEEQTRCLSVSYYSDSLGRGSTVSSATFKGGEWRYVAPETIADAELRVACSKK